ncbi:hypothetical protein JCM3770_006264 [Rhodotorula araucariae]
MAASPDPASASASAWTAHLVGRLDADLAFLAAQGLLAPTDLALIRTKLAPIQHQHQPLEHALAGLAVSPARAVPPPPPLPASASAAGQKARCRAVWDYHQSQPDDLAFAAGDVITIEDEVNADWWKGSLNGRTGLFPCNHVERLPDSTSPASAPSADGYDHAPYGAPPHHHQQQQQQQWAPPPPPSVAPSHAYQQPQFYGSSHAAGPASEKAPYGAPPPPPPSQQQQYGYTAPAPAPQPPVVVQEEKKHKFGRFGKTMGTAVAGGVGFGVGSSLASEAVHAIF